MKCLFKAYFLGKTSYFSRKQDGHLTLKCQTLFSGKNNKTISKCHVLKFLSSKLSVKNITSAHSKHACISEPDE